MVKIYTKTGDTGETSLFGAKRVYKSDRRIEAYGSVDELNAVIGQVLAENPPDKIAEALGRIQNDLFEIGAILAAPQTSKVEERSFLETEATPFLEQMIDQLEAMLDPLNRFILPGGGKVGAALHLARTVCRRAERAVVFLLSQKETVPTEVVKYLNRLSDLFFVMARWANKKENIPETLWAKQNKGTGR